MSTSEKKRPSRAVVKPSSMASLSASAPRSSHSSGPSRAIMRSPATRQVLIGVSSRKPRTWPTSIAAAGGSRKENRALAASGRVAMAAAGSTMGALPGGVKENRLPHLRSGETCSGGHVKDLSVPCPPARDQRQRNGSAAGLAPVRRGDVAEHPHGHRLMGILDD